MPWLDFLPSSARLESELAQLNSNSTLQLDELYRAFRAVQLDVIITINIDDVNKNIHKFVLPSFVVTKFHLGTIYISGKVIFGCKGPDHLQLMNKNHMAISYWLDSIQLDQGLAQLSSKHFSAKFGSTQLSSRDFWLNSAQLEKLPARTKPNIPRFRI